MDVFLQLLSTFIFSRQNLTLNLNLVDSARLGAQ